MADSTTRVFGLLVAYVVPGFVGLTGLVPLFPPVAQWLHPVDQQALGFGPPVYAILAATAIGLVVSCFRWLLVDQLLHWTGIRRPRWNDDRLPETLEGFDYLVQHHFRYYEFCGNTLIAALWSYLLNRTFQTVTSLGVGTDLGMVILSLVLFAASRDALANYFRRTARLVGEVAEKESQGNNMFNGNHHAEEGSDSQKKPTPNKAEKPEAQLPQAQVKDGEETPRSPKATK